MIILELTPSSSTKKLCLALVLVHLHFKMTTFCDLIVEGALEFVCMLVVVGSLACVAGWKGRQKCLAIWFSGDELF